jgi:hypothetical protein
MLFKLLIAVAMCTGTAAAEDLGAVEGQPVSCHKSLAFL